MKKDITYGLSRIVIGLMFFFVGLWKIMNSGAFTSNFAIFGASLPFLAWILLFSELVFGFSVLIGWKVKYTTWPLLVILAGAVIVALIPNFSFGVGSITVIGFHFLAILVLVNLMANGPGEWAVQNN